MKLNYEWQNGIPQTAEEYKAMTRNISNVNNINGQSYSIGDVHIHCFGITSKDVAQQVVTELDKTFFGMSNYANQRASVTR